MNAIQIHVAIVGHRHGTNVYPSLSDAGMWKLVAEYCREYWADQGFEEDHTGLSDPEVVGRFFEGGDEDFANYTTAHLELSGASIEELGRAISLLSAQLRTLL